MNNPALQQNKSLILFDGVCNYCNNVINFIARHDRQDHFLFCAIQTEKGKEVMEQYHLHEVAAESVILVEGQNIYTKSTAVFRIFRKLNGFIPLLYGFMAVPAYLRNQVYDFIAKRRYRWFGKKDTCMVPDEKWKSKFL